MKVKMITNVNIKNFKSISDLSADINGSVIILKGENGVGKSSFLQAVAMLLTGSKDKSVLKRTVYHNRQSQRRS